MLPTCEQLNRINALVWELHDLTARSCTEVARALLATRTLRSFGYRGNGRIETQEQADACIHLLESWIRKKSNEH